MRIVSIFCFLVIFYSCVTRNEVDFSTEVKPIINNHCIACHGGVKKSGGFSLLFEDEAKEKLESGDYGIVAGHPGDSKVIELIKSDDPELRMPYDKEPLTKEEIKTLTRWIKQGAKWGNHWAYELIKEAPIPKNNSDWIHNPIDNFVLEKASHKGLSPSFSASPADLARRVSLDLIGFIPDIETVSRYIEDPTAENYSILVDSLLASPHFGEKWTSMWLDIARYADSKGYERDLYRPIWQYRDWVIDAFNDDMPYDQFLINQLAGDLIPSPDEGNYIATSFHRNTMTNDEGGTDNEEFRVAAVIDRVNTTWEGIMGTSFSCVQCHSHPYDPFRMEEYYQFYDYFNQSLDYDTFSDYPILRKYDSVGQERLEKFHEASSNFLSQTEEDHIMKFLKTWQPIVYGLECDSFSNSELLDTKFLVLRKNGSARLPDTPLEDKKGLVFRYRTGFSRGRFKIHENSPHGPVVAHFTNTSKTEGWKIKRIPITSKNPRSRLYITYSNQEVQDFDASGMVFDWFYFDEGEIDQLPMALKNEYWDLVNYPVTTTPIMLDRRKSRARQTYVFERGNWLTHGDPVDVGVPAVFSVQKDFPPNRLGMAEWMTDPDNPLVSRTMVNRVWAEFFGRGIVETLEDLGTQGAIPTHQELLEYLSYTFMHDHKWSLKRLMKEIVMSSTYRQDATVSDSEAEKDPFNYYLARGARVRLSAEQIRDQALSAAMVMNSDLHGPPVMPYQPDGIWVAPYSGEKWVNATDSSKYRRAVYIFWKRTNPYPSLENFDAVGREVCTARRIATNTPLQALTTLNDPFYLDVSAQFAKKTWTGNPKTSIQKAYKRLTLKDISEDRLSPLLTLYNKSLETSLKAENPEIEAFAIVTNALLNLDEVIMKN